MTWNQVFRQMERAGRRSERAAMQRHRQLQREMARYHKISTKLAEQEAARSSVEQFESFIDVLVSVHKDCSDRWDWDEIARSGEPRVPEPNTTHEDKARALLASYKPSFFERLFRQVEKRLIEFGRNIAAAQSKDQAEHNEALVKHRQNVIEWDIARKTAAAVLKRDLDAFKKALEITEAFAELDEFKTKVTIASIADDVIALDCFLKDEGLVPKEEVKLTSTGKLSRKDMPASRYWTLHQDYVCSCALRVARETFAVLPLDRVIVNVRARRMDPSVGQVVDMTLLGVHFTRSGLGRLNMEAIDPSDSLKNFGFRMKFKKSAGFEPVDPVTPDEQWVSA